MSRAHLAVSAGLAAVLALAPATLASAQSTLAAALDLYDAAAYDDALAALDHARQAQPSGDDLVTIERHRLLCLVALGRTAAAQDVVAELLDARPGFVLTAAEASPRVRAVFDSARARLLPDLVRRRYADAKRAYDAGDLAAARDGFAHVSALLADPAVAASDPTVADLQVLATGFLQLSVASLEQGRRARDVETVQAALQVLAVSSTPLFAAPPALAAAVTAAVPPPAEIESPKFAPMNIFTYDWRDTDVTPPVALAQPLSGWWGSMGAPAAGTQLGAVEVEVDESGVVVDARIYLSVNRFYDSVLLESAKQWRYRPATKDGRPVKYRRVTGVVSGR